MKYGNQINIAAATLGVVIAVYSFSVTFFSPGEEVQIDLQELKAEAASVNLSETPDRVPESSGVLMRSATTTANSALERNRISGSNRPRESASPASGAVSSPSRATAPERRSLSTQRPTGPNTISVGSRSRTGDAAGSVPSAPSSGASSSSGVVGGRSSPSSSRSGFAARPGRPTPTRPPAASGAQKRDATSNPSTPPVRSSVPVQRPPR